MVLWGKMLRKVRCTRRCVERCMLRINRRDKKKCVLIYHVWNCYIKKNSFERLSQSNSVYKSFSSWLNWNSQLLIVRKQNSSLFFFKNNTINLMNFNRIQLCIIKTHWISPYSLNRKFNKTLEMFNELLITPIRHWLIRRYSESKNKNLPYITHYETKN